MQLKRLEMLGFKSFAQKTVLEFHPGVTSVVGPNGCGKSNIVDALRWAMGEQSARHLRGNHMEDVVFNGSESLPATGMAEVSLVFDNEDGRGPPEYANFSEIMVMSVAMAGGLGQPLNPRQLLWINLISDIFPGLALAMEQPEPDVLNRPPRDPEEPIIKTTDFKRIGFESSTLAAASLAAYGYGIARYGMGAQAGTVGFMSLSFAQLLHALSCRSEQHSLFGPERLPANPYLNVALGTSLGLQALTLLVPTLRTFLGLTPIGLLDAAVIGGSALLPLAVNEATKGNGR
jgi:energy-coupling factor transporter ATP-binding protein EcfA2